MDEKIVYKGNIFSVREVPARSSSGRRQVVEHSGAAGAVVLKEGMVILVKQYREATGGEVIEIPAGLLDGEPPEECVRREMQEEIGAVGGKLTKLTQFFTSPGYSNEVFYLYLLEEPEIIQNSPEESEEIEIVQLPFNKALEMASEGVIQDSKTIIGLLMASERIGAK